MTPDERAAIRALVNALPRCARPGCVAPSTRFVPSFWISREIAETAPTPACDAHAPPDAEDLEWAPALRAVLALVGYEVR